MPELRSSQFHQGLSLGRWRCGEFCWTFCVASLTNEKETKLVNILILVLPSIQYPLSDPPQSATFHPNATLHTIKQNLYSPDVLKTATTTIKDFLAFLWAKLLNTTMANFIIGITGNVTPLVIGANSSAHGFLTEDPLSIHVLLQRSPSEVRGLVYE